MRLQPCFNASALNASTNLKILPTRSTVRGDMRALLALEDGRFSRANLLAQPARASAKFVSTPP